MPQSLTNAIYNMEQKFSIKNTAFGRRLKQSKSKKRNKSKPLLQNSKNKTKRYKKI
jgi:hypothetical protein